MKIVHAFDQLPNVVRKHRFDYQGNNGPITCFCRLIKNPHPIDHQYPYTVAWTTDKALAGMYLSWNTLTPISDEEIEKMIDAYFQDRL